MKAKNEPCTDLCLLKRAVLFLFFCPLLFSTLFSQVTIENVKTSSPPEIDGVLDEPVWKKTRGYSDFKSIAPEYGKLPKEKTIVYSAYDSDNLYFAFKCYDKEPGKIIATIRKRDTIAGEDKVAVFIDSHNDGQNAYLFMINPLGIQMDGVMNSTADIFDYSQDFVWDAAGVKNADGYTVEVKIPLKSLRFPKTKVAKMRAGFIRKITRYSEQYAFPEWKHGAGSILGQQAFFQLEGINYRRVLEIIPAVTYRKQKERDSMETLVSSDEKKPGVTAKIGLTSDLTLDMTINPDFSHIEIDEGQVDVNLRFDPLYEEKRPFFLEGLEHFTFAGCGDNNPVEKIVHTRNIVEPILGLKISGKIGKSGIVNSLFAIDEFPKQADVSTSDDERGNYYYGILRYKHIIRNDSYIGTIYTGKEYSNGFNHVGGVDSKIRLSGFMTLSTFFLYSFKKSPGTADQAAAETKGAAFGWKLNYESRKYNAYLGYHDLAKNFDLDPGRVIRNGIRIFSADAERYIYMPSGFLKAITLGYSGILARDKHFGMNEYSHKLYSTFEFSSETNLDIGYRLATEVYMGTLFNTNGFFIDAESRLTKYLKLAFSYRFGGSPYYHPSLLQGNLKKFSIYANFRPGRKFSTVFNFTRHIFHENETNTKIYDIGIYRNKTTFQVNKYLSLRGIVEYNSELRKLLIDSLVEFTYIPGTVIHLGYGSSFAKRYDTPHRPIFYDHFREVSSSLFFKASYLFRF